jgi:hypothetical protein
MTLNKTVVVYWTIIGLLLFGIVVVVLKCVVLGKTEPAADGRIAVVLDPPERAFVLNEMRQFLAGTQRILEAAERNDPAALAQAARPLGMAAARNTPAGMAAKLPLAFKTLGFSVHGDFDRIAMDAESLKDVRLSLQQLSETLKKCVACHASYQLAVTTAGGRASR